MPPLDIKYFERPFARRISEFHPEVIEQIFGMKAAGINPLRRPTPQQLRDWMNAESEVPKKYHEAIFDTVCDLNGPLMRRIRANCGTSIRGLVHLSHETGAFRFQRMYLDQVADIGKEHNDWDHWLARTYH